MDAYLASAELRDADSFYFNVSFELLYGCKFSCRGCFVNTKGASPMTDAYYEQLKSVMDSTERGLYRPFIAFVNPTDFLVAENTVEVLSDPRVVDILGRFKRLSFLSTFLDLKQTEAIGEVLRTHYGHMELEINILIEPEKIRNSKYIATLQRNQARALEIIDWHEPVRNFGIMNVYDFSQTKMAQVLADYDEMNTAVNTLFETTIDFNFSLGRKGMTLMKGEFQKAAEQIRDLFDSAMVSEDRRAYLRFSFGKITDSLVERQYNWHAGKFYLSPLLYERYAAFIPALEVPLTEYVIEEFEQFEQEIELRQYAHLDSKTECEDCEFLNSCVQRQILHLMDIYGLADCLVAKEAIRLVN